MSSLATVSALVGGAILCAIILMTCVSIVGRALAFLGTGPVRGDFELTEMGMALAVFCFLPWAQIRDAHASVDLFSERLPTLAQDLLLVLWDVVLTAVSALILWRLYWGMEDALRYSDTSYLLQIPIWIPYAASLLPASIAVAVSAYVTTCRALKVVRPSDAREEEKPS